MAETSAPPEQDRGPLALTWSAWRIAAVVASIAMILFWIWILTGGPKRANPDRLDDRAFVERTHERCKVLRTDLAALPNAQFIDSATERAAVLEQATDKVKAMIDRIEADGPKTGDDAPSLDGWIGDWRTYISDRYQYAQRLRNDPDAQMFVSENEVLKDTVDRTIEIFADVNDMPDCATPGDVG